MTETKSCEYEVENRDSAMFSPTRWRHCSKRATHVVVHPGGREHGTKDVCGQHARKLWADPFPWLVDWEESARRFGTKNRVTDPKRTGIGSNW